MGLSVGTQLFMRNRIEYAKSRYERKSYRKKKKKKSFS